MSKLKRIVLARRPQGAPTPEDFRLEEAGLPEPGQDEVLVRTLWLSLDPYMRGRMSEGPSYAAPVGPGRGHGGRVRGRGPGEPAPRPRRGRPGRRPRRLAGPFRPARPRTAAQARSRRAPRSRQRWACSACRASRPMPACSPSAGRKPGETVVVGAASGAVGRHRRPDRQAQGCPGRRDRRRRRQMPLRRGGARLRALPRPPRPRTSPARLARRLPRRDRRLSSSSWAARSSGPSCRSSTGTPGSR